MGLTILFMDPQKSFKYIFQYKLRSHSIIHTFKNYFITVFSIFSNKWYSNRPFNFNNCTVSVLLPSVSATFGFFIPRHRLCDHQTQQDTYIYTFFGPTILFTLLKIILLYGSVWIQLKTEKWKLKSENWKVKTEKHYSKIIFKRVNNIVGPIFNKKVVEK